MSANERSAGRCIGWDLGGAHLKAALAAPDGAVLDAVQLPCPLWLGLDRLTTAVATVLERWPDVGRHAITMTGELADVFENRADGVRVLTRTMAGLLGSAELRIHGGARGLLPVADAVAAAASVASANWLATAAGVAERLHQGVLVDVGSTTTDIVVCRDGAPAALGTTDAERLLCDELIYTGVVRTPVHALAGRVPFAGQWQTLMAEQFATAADVYRLTGDLPPDADQMPSADGRGKSPAESAARVARMLGRDGSDADMQAWVQVAHYLALCQRAYLMDALQRALSRGLVAVDAPVVGAGCGRFVARRLAAGCGRAYIDFASLYGCPKSIADIVSVCAPAAALAALGVTARF